MCLGQRNVHVALICNLCGKGGKSVGDLGCSCVKYANEFNGLNYALLGLCGGKTAKNCLTTSNRLFLFPRKSGAISRQKGQEINDIRANFDKIVGSGESVNLDYGYRLALFSLG